MILLDTNVVSEPLEPAPDPRVVAWLDAQAPETLFLSAVSLAELLGGVAALPAGKRRLALSAAVRDVATTWLSGRVLAFDATAAEAFASVFMGARRAGNTMGFADCAIAATAAAHHLAIATRNGRDFRGTGVPIIDPWTTSG